MNPSRFYITGTDTGVGKTRVTAAVARAIAPATIVKLVQTGLTRDQRDGDAEVAAALAGDGVRARECVRYPEPADAWNAALAAGATPWTPPQFERALSDIAGPVVLEGSGGAAVPLDATRSLSDLVAHLGARAILVVGLRLGCINHALLTTEYLAARALRPVATILVDAFGPTTAAYRAQVERALVAAGLRVAAYLPHDDDAGRSVASAAASLRDAAREWVDGPQARTGKIDDLRDPLTSGP